MVTRRERVVLDLESNLPAGMLRGAASTQVLRMELERLSTASVRSTKVSQDQSRSLDRVDASARKADQSINQLTGRIRLFADLIAIFGPGIVPMLGAAGAGVMALAAQMGSAAIAGGVLLGSLQGVGDGLKAIHEADIEPTAENLAELDKVMASLSPAAREFARQGYELLPMLKALRDTGAANLFPGLMSSLDNLEQLESEFARIMRTNGRVVGNMADDITESLASDRWADFLAFAATDGPQAVRQLTQTVGSLTHGLAELWMAFDPVNDDAGRWMRDMARDFDAWATKLDQTQGFEDFVEYIRTTGPQVADMLGSLFNALVQIGQAAAPLGGPVLEGTTALLDVLAAIADSDAGPTIMAAVTAMALLSRGAKLYETAAGSAFSRTHVANIRGMAAALDTTSRSQERASLSVSAYAEAEKKRGAAVRDGMKSLGKGAALMGGLAVASSGAADSLGLTNTISLALMGTMAGPWGAAVGGAIGLMLDLGSSQDNTAGRVADLTATFDAQTGAITENTRAKSNQQAQDAGLLSAAEEIGLRASVVTDAIMGNVEAQNLLNDAVAQYGVSYSITSVKDMRKNYSEAEIGAELATRAATKLRDEIPGLTSDFSSASEAAAQFGRGMDGAGESTYRAESRVEAFTRSVARLERLLSTRAGLRDYEQALDDFTKSLKENGRNWDINTQKGRDNQAALDDIVGTTLKVAEGLRGANRQRFLTNAISDLRTMANNANIPQSQIRQLIRLLREANGVRVRPVIDADTVRAMSAIERVRNALAGIKDKTVTVRVTQTGAGVTPGFGPVREARGGVLDFYANGGVRENHVAQIAPAGSWRVWAEPETGGEAYIPLSPAKRGRSIDIWEEVGSRLGVSFARYAEGGVTGDKDGKDKRPVRRGVGLPADVAELINGFGGLARALRQSERALEQETQERGNAVSALEATQSAMAELAEAATAGFSGDPFREREGSDSDPAWRAGARGGRAGTADPIAALMEDIAYGQRREGLIKDAQRAGLGGSTPGEQAALAEALRGANNDALAAMLAAGTVQQFEDLFIQRQALVGSVGGNAAEAVMGEELRANREELQRQTDEMREVKEQVAALRREQDAREEREAQRGKDNAHASGEAAASGVVKGGNKAARRRRRDT